MPLGMQLVVAFLRNAGVGCGRNFLPRDIPYGNVSKMKKKAKHKRNPSVLKITSADYIKAVKKADREIQLSQSAGFVSKTKIHKSKKVYDRKKKWDNERNETDND